MHHWNPFSKERRLERRDTVIGVLMFVGLILALPGGILVFIFAFGGSVSGLPIEGIFNVVKWLPLVGILMYVGGLAYGIHSEKTQHVGSRHVVQHARIIARYAITRDHRMVTDESEFEFLQGLKYFVKVMTPNEGSVEYQCHHAVYLNCGEGMIGDAEIQGQWLGAFRPYMGMQQTHVGQKF